MEVLDNEDINSESVSKKAAKEPSADYDCNFDESAAGGGKDNMHNNDNRRYN